jgi:hypothetical protein
MSTMWAGVVKDSYHRGVAAGEDSGDTPGTASVAACKYFIYKD